MYVEKLIPGAKLEPSKAQMSGATYACANGAVIKNKGQATTEVRVEKPHGHSRNITWQNADIEMPILSTAGLADDAKHVSDITYGREGGHVLELEKTNRSDVVRHGDVYFMKTYFKRKTIQQKPAGFARHGAAA